MSKRKSLLMCCITTVLVGCSTPHTGPDTEASTDIDVQLAVARLRYESYTNEVARAAADNGFVTFDTYYPHKNYQIAVIGSQMNLARAELEAALALSEYTTKEQCLEVMKEALESVCNASKEIASLIEQQLKTDLLQLEAQSTTGNAKQQGADRGGDGIQQMPHADADKPRSIE